MQLVEALRIIGSTGLSFSILGRIGGDATTYPIVWRNDLFNFQYPRSDRRRCNKWGALPVCSGFCTFSILGRIGGDATFSPPTAAWPRPSLSVSSVGSEAMQRCPGMMPRQRQNHFQYPRSDRRRCNIQTSPAFRSGATLSVSSVGSEAMQRRTPTLPPPATRPFSILGRIGGDATRPFALGPKAILLLSVSSVGSEAMQLLGEPQSRSLKFQLSVSSVGSEAMQPSSPTTSPNTIRSFQYPRSDRRRCNLHLIDWLVLLWASFSILGRIGGDATTVRPNTQDDSLPLFQYPRSDRRRCNSAIPVSTVTTVPHLSVSSVGSEAMQPLQPFMRTSLRIVFQYPRSDRRRCNSRSGEGTGFWAPLSVSSVGSEAMQLPDVILSLPTSTLSVSSVGSEAMQPSGHWAHHRRMVSFQYPRSDRRRCNWQKPGRTRRRGTPFSILGRIGGDATRINSKEV